MCNGIEIGGYYSYVTSFFHPYIMGCYGRGSNTELINYFPPGLKCGRYVLTQLILYCETIIRLIDLSKNEKLNPNKQDSYDADIKNLQR